MNIRKIKTRVVKRKVEKCNGVCRTYSDIAFAYADVLANNPEVIEFKCNVPLLGLAEGDYMSDFVITMSDSHTAVRECVFRKNITRPKTAKELELSRKYWITHGIKDWGLVIDAATDDI